MFCLRLVAEGAARAMMFSPRLMRLVLAGEKTVTRRPLPKSYAEGKTYAISTGRGVKHLAHVRIVRITLEHLGAINNAEARLEGFASRQEFIDYWEGLHGHWRSWEIVLRIEFELAASCPDCPARQGEVCPKCGNAKLRRDDEHGDLYCLICGYREICGGMNQAEAAADRSRPKTKPPSHAGKAL